MSESSQDSQTLRFASLVAHQLKSPISAATSLLRALEGGHAGAISERQKDLLRRALQRCDQAIETSGHMMAIARALNQAGPSEETTDLETLVRRTETHYASQARESRISLSLQIQGERSVVRGNTEAMWEILTALIDNAFKYTPEHGHIRVLLSGGSQEDRVRLSVADSGIGIPPADREQVLSPFYRTESAKGSSRPGSGLGLSLVKAVVEADGGSIAIGEADLGGAEITLELPAAQAADKPEGPPQPPQMRVVIVGGVAAGPKAASKVIRMAPHAEVTVVEKGDFLSYAGCGLPYYVSGVVRDNKELMSTPLGMVRDPIFFQNVKNVRVLNRTECVEIDREARRVLVRELSTDRQRWLEYDKLVLATGAEPIVPDVPGTDLPKVFSLHGVEDAEGIRSALAQNRAHDVVIVGGGLLGVEATEALVRKGCRVTIVEKKPQVLSILDWEMARLVEEHLLSRGVKVHVETSVQGLEGDESGVRSVETDRGTLPADMVILAIGVQPRVDLAAGAGLKIGETGAILVDDTMRTSDPDIYAAGDCVQARDLLTGGPCYVPLGSTANKQARVAAVNLCGGEDRFPGVLGSTVCKVFDYCVGRTGLTEAAAKQLGYEVVTALAPAPDRAHFMPDARDLLLKLVADRRTRRLLGAQATGPGAADKRIDVAAMAITSGMTIDELANVDLCYAPPYSPAIDNIITAANILRNKLDGQMSGLSPQQVRQILQSGEDVLFLDVRSPREYEQVRLPGAKLIPLGALRGRLDELPKTGKIITFCKISLRGYEAALLLRSQGFRDVHVLDGGVDMWPYEKVYD